MTLRIEEELLDVVRRMRPLLEKIGKRDAELARQGRRALNSAARRATWVLLPAPSMPSTVMRRPRAPSALLTSVRSRGAGF